MSKVTKLELFCLEQCSSLQSLDLSAFTNVTEIEDYFCYENIQLIGVKFPEKNPRMKKIGNEFLFKCNSLKELDLTPFCCLEEIGESFCFACTSLTTMNLSSCVKSISKIDLAFLEGCCNLQSINFGSGKDEENENHLLATIPREFLRDCSSLEKVDLSMFKKVTSVERYFLHRCDNLRELDLSKGFGKDLVGIGAVFLGKSRVQSFHVTIVIDEKNKEWMTSMISSARQVDLSDSVAFPMIAIKFV
jgi:hypothetical protein